MFELNEKYDVNRSILKCDYIRYSPSKRINTPNSQRYNNIARADSLISLLSSYLR